MNKLQKIGAVIAACLFMGGLVSGLIGSVQGYPTSFMDVFSMVMGGLLLHTFGRDKSNQEIAALKKQIEELKTNRISQDVSAAD